MISVIIPTLNAEPVLPATLTALVPAAVDGVLREVIVADGGSRDRTTKIAEVTGADVVHSDAGRGTQMRTGAQQAKSKWLLFLHPDTVLEDGWHIEAADFMIGVDSGRIKPSAAAFRFRLNDKGVMPRIVESLVSVRCAALRMSYGDQGLLIPRALYNSIGGHPAVPVMEDVGLMRRLGRSRLKMLGARAVASADHYRRDGYVHRMARNQLCHALHAAGVPIPTIARIYGGSSQKA